MNAVKKFFKWFFIVLIALYVLGAVAAYEPADNDNNVASTASNNIVGQVVYTPTETESIESDAHLVEKEPEAAEPVVSYEPIVQNDVELVDEEPVAYAEPIVPMEKKVEIEETIVEESIVEEIVIDEPVVVDEQVVPIGKTYVINTSTNKFHKSSCGSAKTIKDSNRWEYVGTRDEVIGMGYAPCGKCKP